MASPQGGQIAIAMRLRNQLQSVYKMDPLRNEVQGRQGYHCGRLVVRTAAGYRTGGGWPGASAPAQRQGAQCACAIAVGLPNSRLGRLRIVPLTLCSLPWERKVGRVGLEGDPAVRGALCWAEGECQSPGANRLTAQGAVLAVGSDERRLPSCEGARVGVGRVIVDGGCVRRRRSE